VPDWNSLRDEYPFAPHWLDVGGVRMHYVDEGVGETLLFVQIEDREALGDSDGVLCLPGLCAALIGPNDLSISLGVPGQPNHPTMQAAMEQVVAAAARHGVASGIHIRDLEALRAWRAKGMRCLMYSNEVGLLRQAAEQAAKALRT